MSLALQREVPSFLYPQTSKLSEPHLPARKNKWHMTHSKGNREKVERGREGGMEGGVQVRAIRKATAISI